MDDKENWRQIILTKIDAAFAQYDPHRHRALRFVVMNKTSGSQEIDSEFPLPIPAISDQNKADYRRAIVEALPSRVSAMNPNDHEFYLECV